MKTNMKTILMKEFVPSREAVQTDWTLNALMKWVKKNNFPYAVSASGHPTHVFVLKDKPTGEEGEVGCELLVYMIDI